MKAAFFGLKSLCGLLHNTHITIELDNSTAVCYVNAMGGTVSKKCNNIAKEIWNWCIDSEIWLSTCHISGVLNIEANKASRVFNDRTEWKLDHEVFLQLVTTLDETPQLDLFASGLNTQLPKYLSLQPDPQATHIDAFSLKWAETDGYLFPPFSPINRCVQKLTLEQARAIIIAPLWPNQCWFTPLMTAHHFPIASTSKVLELASANRGQAPTKCKTSGLSHLSQRFRSQGPSAGVTEVILSSWRTGTRKQYDSIIGKWNAFCCARQVNTTQAPVSEVLEFLLEQFNRGLSA